MNDSGLLRRVLDTLEAGVCLFDNQGKIQAINRAALRLLGHSEAEWFGRSAATLDAEDCLVGLLEQTLSSGKSFHEQSGLFKPKAGPAVLVNYQLDPLSEGGKPVGAILRFGEAGSPPVCDLALRDSETKLGAILDTLTDGVIAIDANGIIQLFNPAAETLFGYESAEVLGQNVNVLMPAPDHEAHDGYLANYLRTGIKKIIGIGREVTGRRKDGSLFPLHLSIGEALLGEERFFVAITHDLTARRQAAEQILTLSRAVEQSPSAVMITDLQGRIEYVNPSFTHLTGYTLREVIGRSPSLLRSIHTPSQQYQALWQTLAEETEWREEIQDRKKSGELYWALETISPVRNVAGEVTHYLSIQQDITEQKRDKEALQASEERFREVADMTGEWLWEQDPEGRYIYSSNAVYQILGYQPEEILGDTYLSLLTEADKQHWMTELPAMQDVREPFYHLVNRYCHKNGDEVFTESTGIPLFDEHGRLLKWRGVDHDITTRKRYEDDLRLRDRAIEAASVGINISDARLHNNPIIYLNPALSRMTGYSHAELIGQSMAILQGPDTDQTVVDEVRHSLLEGHDCEVVLKNYRKDGTPFWNELLVSPVFNEAGKLTHFIGIQSDITERRRAEEEQHELEIAKQIQSSLLPKGSMQGEGIQIAGFCQPATHVGGDYYDYYLGKETVNMVIADVSGHSVGAALLMAGVRNTLKAVAHRPDPNNPDQGSAEILNALNELLHDDLNGSDLFISMFYLRYNPKQKRLCFSNAGHNYPLWLPANEDQCRELDTEGMILGVKKQVEFAEVCVTLQPGDKILLYTDGITEAQNRAGEFFGVDRLTQHLISNRLASPEMTIQNLLAALREFCGSATFNDDVSLVVVNIE